MDSSILKLLEKDEDESMISGDEVDALQSALISEIEGKNHSSNQQFATCNNVIGDSNTNLHREDILESTPMKERQRSVLGDQNPPQDHRQPGQLVEKPSHVPQASNLQSINNPIVNEPERPQSEYLKQQKMSSQQAHGLREAPVCHLVDNVIALVDKDKRMQIHIVHSKFKKKELTAKRLIQHMRDIVADPVLRMATSKLHMFQPRTDMANYQSVESTGVGGPTNSTIKMTTVPKFERPTSVNGPSKVQSGPISHFQNYSSLPLDSAPLQGSVTKDQTVGPPLSSVDHVKHQSTDQAQKPRSLVQQGVSNVPVIQNNGNPRSSDDDLEKQSSKMVLSTSTTHVSFGFLVQQGVSNVRVKQNNGNPRRSDDDLEKQSSKMVLSTSTTDASFGSLVQQGVSSVPVIQNNGNPRSSDDDLVKQSSKMVLSTSTTDASFDSLVQQGVSSVPVKQKNGNPRRSDDDLEKQSSKMVFSTSTTDASLGSPSITTQLDSSTMVNFPAPSGTIPAGANVWKTPKMPSVGQKKPLEALGSSVSPSSKKQKLCGTSSKRSVKQLNDVTAISGINLEKEEQLLLSRPKKKSHVTKTSRRVVHEEEERTILQKIPLQRKLAEIMAKCGLKRINDDVQRCLSLCVEERMRGLLSDIIRMTKQRIDTEKCRNRTCVTSDIRKQINEMNQKVKEEWERKHGGEEKNEDNDTENEYNRSKQVKENKEEEDKRRAKAANVAVLAAVGGNDAFLKWKLMAETHKKASSEAGKNSEKPYAETGGTRFGKNKGLPKVVRSISVKDVIAVVEKEPQMSRFTLLYRLYNRIYSDVRTQGKT